MEKINKQVMNEIDNRCPCYSKPLNECDCRTQNSFYTEDLLEDAVVVQLPQKRPVIPPRKPQSFT